MPVDVGVAVGYGKGALLRSRDASEAGWERNFITRHHAGHINALLLWEDEGAGLGVDQRPEGAAGEKQSTVGREHPVVAGEEDMHCLSRPGFKNDGFVIFRQAVDFHLLPGDHPEKAAVQCFGTPGAERFGVVDRGLLHDGEETGGSQLPVEGYIAVTHAIRKAKNAHLLAFFN